MASGGAFRSRGVNETGEGRQTGIDVGQRKWSELRRCQNGGRTLYSKPSSLEEQGTSAHRHRSPPMAAYSADVKVKIEIYPPTATRDAYTRRGWRFVGFLHRDIATSEDGNTDAL